MAQASVQPIYPGMDPAIGKFVGGRSQRMLIDGKWVEAA